MKKDDVLIYNPDNEYVSLVNPIFNTIPFTNNLSIDCKNKVIDKTINYDEKVLDLSSVDVKLIGNHNYLNIGFAYIVSNILGISNENFIDSLKTFEPLPHRMEYIGEVRGNKYYNDSISTIPEATINAIKSIPNIKTVIIGGMDRGINYQKLIDFIPYSDVENIVFLPDSGVRIMNELKGRCNKNLVLASDLENAVNIASEITSCGGILLSPAAASYGFYKNFEERGNHFKECVNSLKK